MITLDDILEIENDPWILDLKCQRTGIPLWPSIRVLFLKMIRSDLHYKKSPLVHESKKRNQVKVLKNLAKTSIYNLIKSLDWNNDHDILITSTWTGIFKQNGRFKNRYSDYFASVLERTLVFEALNEAEWPLPRETGIDVLFYDPYKFATSLQARSNPISDRTDEVVNFIDNLEERSKYYIDWELNEKRRNVLISKLEHLLKVLPIRYRAYQNFFKKRNIKVLLGKSLSYGSDAMVPAARDLGIVIAEYQHGLISRGHEAYNVAPALEQSEGFRRILPDHFLGYGKWWNDQFNVPVEKHVIGNPHRTEKLKSFSKSKKGNNILILCGGAETEVYTELAIGLSTKMDKSMQIVLRPHPKNRHLFITGNRFRSFENISIDLNPDIYPSFQASEIVVSEFSTGLFEAIGLVDRIFIWETGKSRFTLPDHPFGTFVEAEQLSNKITDGIEGFISGKKKEDIWAPNWEDNYLNFIHQYGKIEC